MSFPRTKFVNIAAIALTATAMSACQDAVTPITSPANVPATRAFSVQSKASRNVISDQYIVVLREGYDVGAQATRLVGKAKGKVKNKYTKGLKGFSASMSADDAAHLESDPSVAYVEQDQRVIAQGKPGAAVPATTSVTQRKAPWNLDRIDQSAKSLNGSYTYAADGAGVNVYIIDSGIRTTHVEFGGRATADYSAINDGYGATGCNWHGTHVAGIVGGKTVGVAKAARLHSVRVLDCNAGGSMSDVLAGIDWVIANHVAPSVANVSISGSVSAVLNDAIERAIVSGVTMVVAAGNDQADACGYSPASAQNAITVASVYQSDITSSFTNFGRCVDIVAPGEGINSATNSSDSGMLIASGTSMAAPHVAGAAALLLQKTPAATPVEIRAVLSTNATPNALTALPAGTANLLLRVK